jgi:hypothetical protein
MFLSKWNVRSMSGHVSELVVSSFVAIPCRLKDNQDVNHGSIYRASRELWVGTQNWIESRPLLCSLCFKAKVSIRHLDCTFQILVELALKSDLAMPETIESKAGNLWDLSLPTSRIPQFRLSTGTRSSLEATLMQSIPGGEMMTEVLPHSRLSSKEPDSVTNNGLWQ